MVRKVRVGLEVDEAPFVRGMERAERAAGKLDDALDDVAGSAKASAAATESAKESTEDLGASAKDSGRALSSLRDDAAKLDKQIDETSRSIRELARQIAATSDEAERVDLTKKLRIDQRALRQQLNLRKLMEVEADEAARGFVARFGGSVGPLMASMPIGPGVAAAGGVIAAAMAPTLGAGLAGAVVGGAAGVGIVGGAVLAARDARVKAAGAELGAFVLGDLEKRAAGFVPVMLDAIGDVRTGWADMGADLSRIFGSSRLVDPLVQGALSGAKRVVAGVADLVDEADPVVNALSMSMERLGDATGDTLSTLAQDADEGASALNDLTVATANLIRTAGGLIHLAATVKGYADNIDVALDKGRYWIEDNSYLAEKLRAVGVELDITADGFAAGSVEAEAYRAATLGTADAADFAALKAAGMTDAQIAAADASGRYRAQASEAATATGSLATGFSDGSQSVEEFTAKLDNLNASLYESITGNISAEQANIRLEEAIDAAAKAAKDGADKGIDPNTAAGRRNRTALLGIADAAVNSAEAIFAQTNSQELASEATERGRAKFLASAKAMGVSKAEAERLANQLFGIPRDTKADVNVAIKETPFNLQTLQGRIAAIKSKRVVITVVNNEITTRSEGRNVGIGDGVGGRRWGGVVEHAQWGTLREAQIASPVAPARYAWAEPATGGEAFIPKYGNRERSLDILATAARWYGQQIMPAGGGGGGGGAVTFDNRITVQPLQANFTVADLSALQARQDALSRVGRPR